MEAETGVVYVDTYKHHNALRLTLFCTVSPFIQSVQYGDKDCFRFAWLTLGHSFALSRLPPALGLHKQQRRFILQGLKQTYFFVHLMKCYHGKNFTDEMVLALPDVDVSDYTYSLPTYDDFHRDVLEKSHSLALLNTTPYFHLINAWCFMSFDL